MKHTPATPLPFSINGLWHLQGTRTMPGDNRPLVIAQFTPLAKEHDGQDAAYIAHAANAYPRLVEALRNLHRPLSKGWKVDDMEERISDAGDLLRELGEGV